MTQSAAAERNRTIGDSRWLGSERMSRQRDHSIAAVTMPSRMKPSTWLRAKDPRMRAIQTGTSNTATAASKSHDGPKVSVSGRDRYNPPTAKAARAAGHRGSDALSFFAGAWLILLQTAYSKSF